MGLIEIEGMEFYAYHGHYEEEQIVGNKFIVYLSMEVDCVAASQSDNLNDAVNYQLAYGIVKHEMQAQKSYLLENIAGRILTNLMTNMEGIKHVKVKISKINPPMGGKIQQVSVTMEKSA